MNFQPLERIKNDFGAWFYRVGFSANVITVAGLALAFLSGWMSYEGKFFLAGIFLLLSGFLDLMDGAVARLSKTISPFGGILDSCLDRYGDGFALGGILLYCTATGRLFYSFLVLSALLGSFEVSYVRARAECVIPKCKVGYWERGERVVTLCIGLLFNNLGCVLWFLALGPHWTALQRLYFAGTGRTLHPWAASGRSGRPYPVKTAILFIIFLIFRPAF